MTNPDLWAKPDRLDEILAQSDLSPEDRAIVSEHADRLLAEEPPPAEPIYLPALVDAGGQLDIDRMRQMAPMVRMQLTNSLRRAASELRANRGEVVYPEDTYDLVRRLTAGGEVLRQWRDAFEAAAKEAEALTEEEALTAMGEQDGALMGSLFVPDGEGQRIAVRAEWKAGTTTWDLTTLCGWLAESQAQDAIDGMRNSGLWDALDNRQKQEVAAAIADNARAALDRLLALGKFAPGVKAVEALRLRYAERQEDDTAALLRGLRSTGTRTYQGVKITREEAK